MGGALLIALIFGAGLALARLAHARNAGDGALADRIEACLPRTQCAQCGYPGCRPYAEAVAAGDADIDRCPPGGEATRRALAELLNRPPPADAPAAASPSAAPPAMVAVIDAQDCVGCALCMQACPVDAIVGAPQRLHGVLPDECTGCELCVAPCPVDCIRMLPADARAAPPAMAAPAVRPPDKARPPVEARPSIEQRPPIEKQPSIMKRPSIKERPLVEKRPPIEQHPTIEKQPSIKERPPSAAARVPAAARTLAAPRTPAALRIPTAPRAPAAPRPCVQCDACSAVCPAGLPARALYHRARRAAWDEARALGMERCVECGLCTAACPSELPLDELFAQALAVAAEQAHSAARGARAQLRYDARRRRLADAAARAREARAARLPPATAPH